MSIQSPTIETSITIRSSSVELDFLTLSKLLGREPDSTRSLDHVTATGRPAPVRSSEWTVSTGANVVDSVDDGLQKLVGLFSSWASIATFCGANDYEVSITSRMLIYDWDDRPFIELSAASIELLRQVRASWQLDWVDLSR
jgi:hypothetical protein